MQATGAAEVCDTDGASEMSRALDLMEMEVVRRGKVDLAFQAMRMIKVIVFVRQHIRLGVEAARTGFKNARHG